MMRPKIGVCLIGVNGCVATTLTAGVFAIRRKLVNPYGLVTELEEFKDVDLLALEDLHFFGWDLRAQPHIEWMTKHGTVPSWILAAVESEARQVEVLQPPCIGNSGITATLEGVFARKEICSREEAVATLVSQLNAIQKARNLTGLVVVNLASTEALKPLSVVHRTLQSFKRGLRENHPSISPGMLYAYAAISAGIPYINFTPSLTADVPALVELAKKRKVVIAGKDGKTGQTLYKTVLAPMLRQRNLRVSGWFSTNVLGNDDGLVLQKPGPGNAKLATKREALEHILGYNDFNHQVHIHYYPPRGDAKEAWDIIDFLGWMETRMSVRVNWMGQDSALAAPLVVDLVRLVWLAQQRGEFGPAIHLASFFKKPMGTNQHSFFEQVQCLLEYCRKHASNGARRHSRRT